MVEMMLHRRRTQTADNNRDIIILQSKRVFETKYINSNNKKQSGKETKGTEDQVRVFQKKAMAEI